MKIDLKSSPMTFTIISGCKNWLQYENKVGLSENQPKSPQKWHFFFQNRYCQKLKYGLTHISRYYIQNGANGIFGGRDYPLAEGCVGLTVPKL